MNVLNYIFERIFDNNSKKITAKNLRESFAKIDEKVDKSSAGIKGVLNVNDSKPSTEAVGKYELSDIGIYTNLVPIIADGLTSPTNTPITTNDQYINSVYWDGINFTQIKTALPANPAKAEQWVAGTYNSGSLAYNNGVVYRVKSSIISTIQEPTATASDWENPFINGTIEKSIESETILDITQVSSIYDTHLFSGFGFTYGAVKGFNRVVLPIWQRADTTDEITKVYLRIRETDYQGTLLFDGVKDVTIPQGTSQDVTFDFNLIENSTNKNIWVEFVCDGLTRFNTTSLPVQNYRYKMPGWGVTNFATQSAEGYSLLTPMAISFRKVTNKLTLIPELSVDKVEVGNMQPVKSDAVAFALKKYETVISDGFQAETSIIKGNETLNNSTSTSTFKGWGQLFAGLTNFNRIGYIFRAFDNSAIPTKVRCIIRKTSNTGTIVFDQTKDVSLALNTNKKVYFDLPELFTNISNDELFISFFANGMFALIGGNASSDFDAAHVVRYSTAILSDTCDYSVTGFKAQMYCEILKGGIIKQISDLEIQRIVSRIVNFTNPDVLLTSKVWIYPGFQYNIFNKNVVIPNFGDNLNNYRIDYSGTIGRQFERGFRLDNTEVSLNKNISLNLQKGGTVLSTKNQNILSTTTNNGTGITRKVLIIGDSTVDGGDINTPLKAIFDSDPMDVTFLGTRGITGLLHEGRGGWTINNYYGVGTKLYTVNVNGLSTPPTTGAIYRQTAGNDFTVVEVNITAGTGYFKLEMRTGSVDLATNGALTKQSGTGESVINYTGVTVDSTNPFYSAATQKFDLATYLTNTGQSLSANDWIFFQLGINDVFNITTLTDAATKVSTMMMQLSDILANITAYNAGIRVGIVVTIPPANQDAFGASYATDQLSELYKTTGLLMFQKKLIEVYDNDMQRGLLRYLVSAHLNLDTDYNFPAAEYAVNSRNTKTISMQNNGVHPDANGNFQIADMYAGIIKYFG